MKNDTPARERVRRRQGDEPRPRQEKPWYAHRLPSLAYHEAGHAVAAYRVGGTIHHVHVAGLRDIDLPGAGNTRWYPRVPPRTRNGFGTPNETIEALAVTYAGPLAWARKAQHRKPWALGDHGRANEFIRDYGLKESDVADAKTLAARIIQRDWPAIDALANRLLVSDYLEGDEVTATIEAALPAVASEVGE